ncbi:hypothetical protein D1970_15380 [Mesobacillus zeae]|uniref:Uncharacterized protein n=1 Tax=Mesobacillus zeae TaxID=1917180 RepID=A0A398B1G5_9BACI|nr:hypothetical protein D1970_15380 [Mesobacillus zeae]
MLLFRGLVDKRGALVDIALWVNDKSERLNDIFRTLTEKIENLVDIVMDWELVRPGFSLYFNAIPLFLKNEH